MVRPLKDYPTYACSVFIYVRPVARKRGAGTSDTGFLASAVSTSMLLTSLRSVAAEAGG
jgi:hypothetical protein